MCFSTLQIKVYRLIEVIICNHLYSKLYLWKFSLCFGAWTYLLQGWIQIKKKFSSTLKVIKNEAIGIVNLYLQMLWKTLAED